MFKMAIFAADATATLMLIMNELGWSACDCAQQFNIDLGDLSVTALVEVVLVMHKSVYQC